MQRDKRKPGYGVVEPAGRELGRPFDIIFPMAYATVFALIALWVHVKFFPIGDVGVESDFYQGLVPAAQELWRGNLSVASYPYKGPFYSFALVFVHLFGGDWYRNAVVLNVLCAAGSILVLYRLLLRVFDRRLAVIATVSVSLVAVFFTHAHKASTDMLFFFLCYLAISSLLVDRWRWLAVVGAGAFSAFAFLTRYNGAFLLVAATFVVLFVNPWSWPRRRRLIAVAIYLVVFVLVCAPWFVLNRVETGSLLETDNLRNITEEFYGGPENRDVPTGEFSSLGSLIAHDPGHFIGHYLLNIPRHLWLDITGAVGFNTGIPILMLLGLLLLLLFPPTRWQWAFYSFGIVYFLSMCMVFRVPRFALPIVPMYVALAFSAIVGPHGERRSRLGGAVSDRASAGFRRLARRDITGIHMAVVAGVFLLQIFGIVVGEKFYFERRPLFVLHAAQFLREHAGRADHADQQVVMARKPHIAYYSRMKYQMYPLHPADSREFITFAIEHDVDYMVYSPLERMYYRGGDWLASVENTAGIEKIFSDEGVTVYEIADWLDLDEEDGRRGLASRLTHLQELEQSNDPEAIMRACSEISLLYSYNGRPGKAAEYLIRGLEAARRLSDRAQADRQIRALRLEFMAVARAYFKQGRRDEGAAVLEDALLELQHYWTQKERAFIHSALSEYYSGQKQSEDAARHLRALQDLRSRPDGQHQSDVTKSLTRDLDAEE